MAFNKLFLMKRSFNLKIKEGILVDENLNELHMVLNQLTSYKMFLNILLHEEMHQKSMVEEISNMEALSLGDYTRKSERKKSR